MRPEDRKELDELLGCKPTIYHVGVSGGKDSGALFLWMLKESGIPHEQIIITFADTGNEHEYTYEQIRKMNEIFPIETLQPVDAFDGLVRRKGLFPTRKRRFCTEFLKIRPAQDKLLELQQAGYNVVSVSGVRADESEDRKDLQEWDYSGTLLCEQWRPLIKWTIEDVFAIHRKYGLPLNPLYALGAERVGCFPCINSRKSEMRLITLNFPDRIDSIRQLEEELGDASFFHRNTVPERFRTKQITTKDGETMMVASIDDVTRWSLTGKRAQGSYLDDPPEPRSCNSGFCE